MTEVAITGPIGYRRYVLEKTCESNVGHTHNYDHTTIVIRGSIRVTISKQDADGNTVTVGSREYSAGEVVFIAANLMHTIKALEDNSVYMCVFSHRDFDGLVTQKYVGNGAAYR